MCRSIWSKGTDLESVNQRVFWGSNPHSHIIGGKNIMMGLKTIYEYDDEIKKERDNLEFYKSTQEALDRCDDSKKGMSVVVENPKKRDKK